MYKVDKIDKQTKIINNILKIFNILIYIIIVPLAIYNLVIVTKKVLNPNQTPDFLGIKNFVIISGSMIPTINVNDLAIVKNVSNQSEIGVNDIISFRKDGVVTTHRVNSIKVENDNILYVTKGDNNNTVDLEPVSFSQIEGKYLFEIPGIGNFANLLQNYFAIGILLSILVINYFLSMSRKEKREYRKEKRRVHNLKRKNILPM